MAPGLVQVAVRPEVWRIGAATGLAAQCPKTTYLGSCDASNGDTALGPAFVVSSALSQVRTAGAQTCLSLAAQGASVVPVVT